MLINRLPSADRTLGNVTRARDDAGLWSGALRHAKSGYIRATHTAHTYLRGFFEYPILSVSEVTYRAGHHVHSVSCSSSADALHPHGQSRRALPVGQLRRRPRVWCSPAPCSMLIPPPMTRSAAYPACSRPISPWCVHPSCRQSICSPHAPAPTSENTAHPIPPSPYPDSRRPPGRCL